MAKEKGATSGVGLCPFSWIEVTKPTGCLFGSGSKLVSEPQQCMTASCQLWDSTRNDCGLITKKE